jgi:hypothetical protein
MSSSKEALSKLVMGSKKRFWEDTWLGDMTLATHTFMI